MCYCGSYVWEVGQAVESEKLLCTYNIMKVEIRNKRLDVEKAKRGNEICKDFSSYKMA